MSRFSFSNTSGTRTVVITPLHRNLNLVSIRRGDELTTSVYSDEDLALLHEATARFRRTRPTAPVE